MSMAGCGNMRSNQSRLRQKTGLNTLADGRAANREGITG